MQFKPQLAIVNQMLSNDAKLLMLSKLHRLTQSSTHYGAVVLKELSAKDAEVGRLLSHRNLEFGFRLLRPGQQTAIGGKVAIAIEAGGAIIEIVPVTLGAPMVTDVR